MTLRTISCEAGSAPRTNGLCTTGGARDRPAPHMDTTLQISSNHEIHQSPGNRDLLFDNPALQQPNDPWVCLRDGHKGPRIETRFCLKAVPWLAIHLHHVFLDLILREFRIEIGPRSVRHRT